MPKISARAEIIEPKIKVKKALISKAKPSLEKQFTRKPEIKDPEIFKRLRLISKSEGKKKIKLKKKPSVKKAKHINKQKKNRPKKNKQ